MTQKKKRIPVERLTAAEVKEIGYDRLNKATEAELKSWTRTLADVANKRLKRLEEKGYSDISQSYQAVEQGGKRGQGKFKTKGKNRNELLQEILRAKGFLDSKTSTITGVKNLINTTKKSLHMNETDELSLSAIDKIGRVWRAIKKDSLAFMKNLGSDTVQQLISEVTQQSENKSVDEIVSELEKAMEEEYKQRQEEFWEMRGGFE